MVSSSLSSCAPRPCARCRKRRVKCDRRPEGCLRCEKISQSCPGYDRVRGFLDEGPNLRQRLTRHSRVSHSSEMDSPGPPLGLDPPVAMEYNPLSTPVSNQMSPFETLECNGSTGPVTVTPPALTTSESTLTISHDDPNFDDMFFDIDPDVYWASADNSCGFTPNVPVVECTTTLDPLTSGIPSPCDIPRDLVQHMVYQPPSDQAIQSSRDRDLERAYLRRYFSEAVSPHLDILDVDKYYAQVVPTRSIRSVLLMETVAAISAKQFGNRKKEENFPGSRGPCGLDALNDGVPIDWLYEAASYYDRAIRHIIKSLAEFNAKNTKMKKTKSSDNNGRETPHNSAMLGEATQTHNLEAIDDVLSAISILLLYESLDNRQPTMFQHMIGARQLLYIDLPACPFPSSPWPALFSPSSTFQPSRAWQASFWNFALFDYLISYATESHTTLDTADFGLWNASGLSLTNIDGQFVPTSLCLGQGSSMPQKMNEIVACRTIIWVILKTLNFVAAGKQKAGQATTNDFNESPSRSLPEVGPNDISWNRINKYLEDWFAALPDNFVPCVRISRGKEYSISHLASAATTEQCVNSTSRSALGSPFPEIFYGSPLAAISLLLYHFARTLLLSHKPYDHEDFKSQVGSRRINSYRNLSKQMNVHASEICGIAIGRPQSPIELQLLQPLYIAGLCLESPEQKTILMDLLMGMQHRTGCSTAWRLAHLKDEWGLDVS